MILIVSKENSRILDALKYMLDAEKLEYVEKKNYEVDDEIEKVIYVDPQKFDLKINMDIPTLFISKEKFDISPFNTFANIIVTKLVEDNEFYTKAQEEYLYKKGIYKIINDKVLDFIDDRLPAGMVIDFDYLALDVKDWVFKFDSISESYAWLSNKNRSSKGKTIKVINFYSNKIYNDSDKEINYLTGYLTLIKQNEEIINMFICDKDEFEKFKTNYYFNLLLKNSNYKSKVYLVNKADLIENDFEIYMALRDGIIIYDDCVYRDTYSDEYSLGTVDCKLESVKEYDNIFAYIVDKYGKELKNGGDNNGI